MIYITGDTHIPIDIGKLNTSKFPQQRCLSAQDYVIICGDFGGVWDHRNTEKYWIMWLNRKNFVTLFVDGNHENHQMLNHDFPIVQFHEGKAHKISEKIFHLMRGEVFVIDGKKIFTMGGASSQDIERREEGKDWWPQEMPSPQEYQNAMDNLKLHNWKVDYMVTHCAPDSIQRRVRGEYDENELTHFLEDVKNRTFFKKWYIGHYHLDKEIDSEYICLFNKIITVE